MRRFTADRWDIDEYFDPEPGTACLDAPTANGARTSITSTLIPVLRDRGEKKAIAIDPGTACCWKPPGKPWSTAANTEPDGLADRGFVGVGFMYHYILVHADNQTFEGPYGNTGTMLRIRAEWRTPWACRVPRSR